MSLCYRLAVVSCIIGWKWRHTRLTTWGKIQLQMIDAFASPMYNYAPLLQACCRKLYNWLKVAPYQADQQLEDDYDYEGLRVLGFGFSSDRDTATFGALIDPDGQVTDFIRLANMKFRRNAWREMDRKAKVRALYTCRYVILSVVVIEVRHFSTKNEFAEGELFSFVLCRLKCFKMESSLPPKSEEFVLSQVNFS